MIRDLFNLDGQFSTTPELMASLAAQGFARRNQVSALQRRAVIEAQALISDVRTGREHEVLMSEAFSPGRFAYVGREVQAKYPALVAFRETMTTSDFTAYLTTDLINIMLWGGFTTNIPAVMPLVKKAPPLADFKTVKRLLIDGAIGPFDEDLGQGQAPAPQVALDPQDPITYDPKVYSRKMSLSWKALYNDTFGIFNDLTSRILTSWNITVADFITRKYWDANGPHASLFKAAFRNLITTTYGASSNNPPLSFQGIADGYNVLLRQQGPEGEPIDFNGTLYLVVPPALAVTAKAIKASVMNQLSVLGGTTNSDGFPSIRLNVGQGVLPDFEIIVDKRIPKVVTAGTVANTAWALVYDPAAQNRPTVEMGMVRDFDTPTVMQRVPDTMRVGGGPDVRMGAFDSGNIDYKSVLVMGGAYGDGRSAAASTGQGS
jgi:hypothetical protein